VFDIGIFVCVFLIFIPTCMCDRILHKLARSSDVWLVVVLLLELVIEIILVIISF